MKLNLFTDDNPETTIKGLGFKTPDITKKSIAKIEYLINQMKKKQKLGDYSPKNLRPRTLLDSKEKINKYFYTQKLYRILGLLNRAKVVYKRYPNKDLQQSIKLLLSWIKK